MRVADLAEHFSAKRRSVSDLARFIRNRTDDHANYCLLLGAGCSVTSGIRPASVLIAEWRTQACTDLGAPNLCNEDAEIAYLKEHGSTWYEPSREYSSLFERRFDLQRQRRVFVESEVAGRLPSIGYAYLTALVEQKYFNTIFTTNFDDLINEAFYLFSDERPIVCAHDSSINSVTITSKRPKIIKLHGDYLFDDLKSTVRETESLEQNMKAKLAEFSKDHGLIVVGYSGTDRSIMDNLQALLRNDEYLKTGIYWCLRSGADVPEELRKLLFRDRVYYVEIGGFDELFAELFDVYNPGQFVPESALGSKRRTSDALHALRDTVADMPSSTEVLRKAKARLEKHTKRSAIAKLIAHEADDGQSTISGTDLTDDELLLLSELSNLLNSEQHTVALNRARAELANDLRPRIRRRILELCIQAHNALGEPHTSIDLANEIIRLYPQRASSYLNKSRLLDRAAEVTAAIEKAIECDPYAVAPRIAQARQFWRQSRDCYGEERTRLLGRCLDAAEAALNIEPSPSNIAWEWKFDVLKELELKPLPRLQALVDGLAARNPNSIRVFDLYRRMYSFFDGPEKGKALEALLSRINAADDRMADDRLLFARVRLETSEDIGDNRRLKVEFDRLSEEIARDPDLASLVAKITRKRFGDDNGAVRLLKDSLRASQFDWEVLTELVQALSDIGSYQEAQQVLEKWSHHLRASARHELKRTILEARGRFDECLDDVVSFSHISGERNKGAEAYYMLATGNFRDAEVLLKEILTPVNFTPEAEVDIVNYELARKLGGHKPNRDRLEKVLGFTKSDQTQVGVYAVLEAKPQLYNALQRAVSSDLTLRYSISRWPAMEPYLNEPKVRNILQGLIQVPQM